MCYAIPGKVVEINGDIATINYFGEKKTALLQHLDGADLKTGDYVYAQAGLVVQKIEKLRAEKILSAWRGAFATLKARDAAMAKRPKLVTKVNDEAETMQILENAVAGKQPTKTQALSLLSLKSGGALKALYATANYLRRVRTKNSCCIHGIIEFSNFCRNNCAYCGLRRSNKIVRYRMPIKEIVACAAYAANVLGFKALVLQSGEDPWFTKERLVKIVKGIRSRCAAVLFMSIGEVDEDVYAAMYEAGARGALVRFETSNPELYAQLCEGQSLNERLDCIRAARRMGYLIATGGLIGLPGQTAKDLVNDIFLTKALGAEMYSFGPFIPAPGTPLSDCCKPALDDVLKVLAVARLIDQDAKILVTTALETLSPDAARRGFLAGAGSCMINVTPYKYRQHYQLYPGKTTIGADVEAHIRKVVALMFSLGRAPTDLGISQNTASNTTQGSSRLSKGV